MNTQEEIYFDQLSKHRERLADALDAPALKPDGVFYASYKEGSFERIRSGRYFCDMDLDTLLNLYKEFNDIQALKAWKSVDVCPGVDTVWVNIIIRKNNHL